MIYDSTSPQEQLLTNPAKNMWCIQTQTTPPPLNPTIW